MSAAAEAGAKRPARRGIVLALALAALVVAVFIGANAHLVYVAISSQPSCVPHMKADDQGGTGGFRAARPAC